MDSSAASRCVIMLSRPAQPGKAPRENMRLLCRNTAIFARTRNHRSETRLHSVGNILNRLAQNISTGFVPERTGMPARWRSRATSAHAHNPSNFKGLNKRLKWPRTFLLTARFVCPTCVVCPSRNGPVRRRHKRRCLEYQFRTRLASFLKAATLEY